MYYFLADFPPGNLCSVFTISAAWLAFPSLLFSNLGGVFLRVSVGVMKYDDQKLLGSGELKFILYSQVSQSSTERSGQELKQPSWRNTAYWLAHLPFSICLRTTRNDIAQSGVGP